MRSLFLSWQNSETRQWHVVGQLSETNAGYSFVYTAGAHDAIRDGFAPLASFPRLEEAYESPELFSAFQNRIQPESRPEYLDYLSWLGLPASEAEPLSILERTGGIRQTDALELFRVPEPDNEGRISGLFFLRGLSHRDPVIQQHISGICPGEPLLLAPDPQNVRDDQAVLLRTEEEIFVPGYLPRYLAPLALTRLQEAADSIRITVERVNPPPAPVQLRLLCRFDTVVAAWDQDWFTRPMFRPLVAFAGDED
jgi:hypothetical protein